MLSRIVIPARRLCANRPFHSSFQRLKVVVENVPALGESITEGTIASWAKSEGDSVAADDVIAIVETDKVTVDIKSPHCGVFVKRLADDTVEVGHPLYEIDVDASAMPADSDSASKPAENEERTATYTGGEAEQHKSQNHSSGGRQPMIRFLGKRQPQKISLRTTVVDSVSRGRHSKPIHQKPAAAPSTSTSAGAGVASSSSMKPRVEGNGVHFTSLQDKAWFGRPKLSAEEIEAIESGGATM